jgi:hypothetical protein
MIVVEYSKNLGGSMIINRFANVILYSSLAGSAAYGLFSLTKSPSSTVVKMKSISRKIDSPNCLTSYPLLAGRVAKGNLPSEIFKVAIHKQRDTLSREQVLELARLAVKNHSAIHLDVLAGDFPDIITPAWVNQAIIQSKNSFLYSELLEAVAGGKIKNLNYLFDPGNEVVLIQDSDNARIKKAAALAPARMIILVNMDEEYDPSYKYHT